MVDTWDEIWKKPAFKEISVPLPPGRPWVSAKVAVDKEWLKEVKAAGDALREKAEKYDKFLREADKETIFNMGSWKSDINILNKIQKMCRKVTDETDVTVLTDLPHRILQILGVPTCPACGYVASKSPCKYCGNDVGMEGS